MKAKYLLHNVEVCVIIESISQNFGIVCSSLIVLDMLGKLGKLINFMSKASEITLNIFTKKVFIFEKFRPLTLTSMMCIFKRFESFFYVFQFPMANSRTRKI